MPYSMIASMMPDGDGDILRLDDLVFAEHDGHQYEGVVTYLGTVQFACEDDWVGVLLTGISVGQGTNNGTVDGEFYFSAPPNGGLFVRKQAVSKRSMETGLQIASLQQQPLPQPQQQQPPPPQPPPSSSSPPPPSPPPTSPPSPPPTLPPPPSPPRSRSPPSSPPDQQAPQTQPLPETELQQETQPQQEVLTLATSLPQEDRYQLLEQQVQALCDRVQVSEETIQTMKDQLEQQKVEVAAAKKTAAEAKAALLSRAVDGHKHAKSADRHTRKKRPAAKTVEHTAALQGRAKRAKSSSSKRKAKANAPEASPNKKQSEEHAKPSVATVSPSSDEHAKPSVAKASPSSEEHAKPSVAMASPSSDMKTSYKLMFSGPPDEDLPGGWPDGWTKHLYARKKGGRADRYWFSPLLKLRFRSIKEVNRYLGLLQGPAGGNEKLAFEMFKGYYK